ncbi:flavodoxin family protein [Anaerocolumna xylanovorans]|uniref:Flavodoxin n=1 Tax=Anaerocolumna xylanovorans DSM 12503 TaxID=1121345 RepID=A0A1M7YK68_9FIRM|nr:hypothetical protein [Anaerocolumna xylanovorans]SHO53014.1 hypothetical protein SAMN02745217_03917 [Anaerocolumna xylanovorans DSM 12503]
MRTAVISYSYTGNNKALACSVAKELSADHIEISVSKARTMQSIIWDMIFGRMPKVEPSPDIITTYDRVLFFAPVWMGHIASPLRPYLHYLKKHPNRYGFISISGGADGTNPKLKDDLKKRTGAEPIALLDLHIADLLSSSQKPARKDTSSYQLKEKDLKQLTDLAVGVIKN